MRALAEVTNASSCSIGLCFSEHERCFSNISPRFVPLRGMMTTGTETWLQSITVSGDITIPAGELVISDGLSSGTTHILFPEAVDFRHCVTPLLNAEFNLGIIPLRHRVRRVSFFQSKQSYIQKGGPQMPGPMSNTLDERQADVAAADSVELVE
jgi:hypothetical protein